MASNRDPRKKSRYNRRRLTSSADRAARSKASSKDTPRPTSSSTRASTKGAGQSEVTSSRRRSRYSSGSTARVTSGTNRQPGPPRGAQGPAQPPVQGPSRRTPNVIGSRPPASRNPPTGGPPRAPRDRTFQIGSKGKPPTPTRPSSRPGATGSRIAAAATTTLAAAALTGSLRNPVSKAKAKEGRTISAATQKAANNKTQQYGPAKNNTSSKPKPTKEGSVVLAKRNGKEGYLFNNKFIAKKFTTKERLRYQARGGK